MPLKELLKDHAYGLGADLVGFGGIDRCRHAPAMMSPQGIYPEARTVIVMAIHHPDACIELGGERHPQEIGPYSVQYLMNSRLDEMSYRMASFLERQGYGAVPIVSSNIWRYNTYKDLKAIFAPDVSHIYMSVVAGLSDIGFSGIALTPEYGTRNRFVTVITNAEIEEDPLIPPGTLCDRCMLCRKHCPSGALSKEIDGEKTLRIGEYEYRFPNKNLWRCAWGEHFDLDLDLEIPEKVTEEIIARKVKEHGFRGGEMGQCLKFCLPKPIRGSDTGYSRAPVRRLGTTLDESIESRAVLDRLIASACARGADEVVVSGREELLSAGVDLEGALPGARSAFTVIVRRPANRAVADAAAEAHAESARAEDFGAEYLADSLCYDLTRALEGLGFRSVMTIERSGSHPEDMKGPNVTGRILKALGMGAGVAANTVISRKAPGTRCATRAARPRTACPGRDWQRATDNATRRLHDWAAGLGADLFGVAPVERIEAILGQIRPHFEGKRILTAKDRSTRFTPWDPEVTTEERRLRRPEDYLPGAKSVVVFGLRYHREAVRMATRPPAEAVGPYAFQTYVTNWLGSVIGFAIVKRLEEMGFRGALAPDLLNASSFTANPRGPQRDLFSNRFAGLAAGLGWLTVSGHLATPEFGIRQRLVAVVTDAPLDPSPLYRPKDGEYRCDACGKACVTGCPSRAITGREAEICLEGASYRFRILDGVLCDWTKRYVLTGESGFKYLGSKVDIDPGSDVTPEKLSRGLASLDPIKKYRPVVAEPCVILCPHGNADADGAGRKAP